MRSPLVRCRWFYQQHSIIGNDENPGVTLLEAESGARVE